MAYRGVDVREPGDRLLFRALLQDAAGEFVTTGAASLRLFRMANTGALETYDFSDNTFKTTAVTTPTQALTHRQGNNSTFDTGIWTHALTTLSGFAAGDICFAHVVHDGTAIKQAREFQFGSGVLSDAVIITAKQDVADSMRLTPAGTVQAGSIDETVTASKNRLAHMTQFVYFQTGGADPTGDPGSWIGTYGTSDNPIGNEAKAKQLADEMKSRRIVVLGGTFTAPLATPFEGYHFEGTNIDAAVDWNGQQFKSCRFRLLSLNGSFATGSSVEINQCAVFGGVSNFNGWATQSSFEGTITITADAYAVFIDCSPVDDFAPPTFDFTNNGSYISIVEWRGSMTIDNLTASNPLSFINLQGVVEFGAGCNNTSINVNGAGSVVDNSGANFTIDRNYFAQVEGGYTLSDTRSWQGTAFGSSVPNMIQDQATNPKFTAPALSLAPGGAGTGSPQLLQSTTIAAVTSQTVFTLTAGATNDDAYPGHMIRIIKQGGTEPHWSGPITSYKASGPPAREVTLKTAPSFTLAVGDTVDIFAAGKTTETQVPQDPTSNTDGQVGRRVLDSPTGSNGVVQPPQVVTLDSEIILVQTNDWDFTVTLNVDLNSPAIQTLWFTVKKTIDEVNDDSKSWLQYETLVGPPETSKLTYVAQEPATTNSGNGTMEIVNAAIGQVRLKLQQVEANKLDRGGDYICDFKVLYPGDTQPTTITAQGKFRVVSPVTRRVTVST